MNSPFDAPEQVDHHAAIQCEQQYQRDRANAAVDQPIHRDLQGAV